MATNRYCKCVYCGIKFDRDAVPIAVIPPANPNPAATRVRYRYAHKDCYLKEKEKNPSLPDYEIREPISEETPDIFDCPLCGKRFNKKEHEFGILPTGQTACIECVKKDAERPKTDKDILLEYLMKLYEEDYAPPNLVKQANHFINEYHFSYKGIYRALKYFYEVQGHKVNKKQLTIGIVPYVYKQAEIYYYNLMLAIQANKDKKIEEYKPNEEIVRINIPTPKPLQKERAASEWWDD